MMDSDEFNKQMLSHTNQFIEKWLGLVDEFSESNELTPNHKLMSLLYSHLGIERLLSQRVWGVGSEFMDAVVKVEKELMKQSAEERA